MKRKIFILLGIAMILLPNFSLVCHGADSATKPQYGGVLKVIFPYPLKAMGYPPNIESTDLYSVLPAIETLTERWPDQPKPGLATGWKIAPDGKSITLELKKGVKFHDGTDFNAEAVKFNLDLQREAKREEVADLTSVDVVDNYTVRLNLSKYNNSLLYQLGWLPGLMVSPTSIKTYGRDWALTHGVGTGPFKVVDFKRNVSVKFERFDGYWDKGKPYLDGIEIRFILNPMTAKASFLAGEAHILWYSTSKDPTILHDIKQRGGYEVAIIDGGVVGLVPDSRNPDSPFAKRQVREALEYAIDRPTMVKGLSYGLWRVLTQPCPEGYPAYNPNIKPRTYNPQKAKDLLAEAGYRNGFETSITSAPTVNQDAMLAIQRYLSQVGIDAKVQQVDPGKWAQIRFEGHKGLFLNTMFAPYGNYASSLERNIPAHYTSFPTLLRPAGYAEALSRALGARDLETEKKLNQEVLKVIYDDAMWMGVLSGMVAAAKQPGVQGDGNCVPSYLTWTPANAWLSK